jgi:CheY-like chemotaxis protein
MTTLEMYVWIAGAGLCGAGLIVFLVSWLISGRKDTSDSSSIESNANRESSDDKAMETRLVRLVREYGNNKNALGWPAEDSGNSEVVELKTDNVLGSEQTILIADDDPVVTFALTRRLQHLGYQVFQTPDATHALLGIKKLNPALAILDLQMPSGNGLAVCEMLACDQDCANIPIIVHSVFADEAIKRRCRQLGAHFVQKSPKSWTEIVQLVETLLHPKEEKSAATSPESPPSSTSGPATTSSIMSSVITTKKPESESIPMAEDTLPAQSVPPPEAAVSEPQTPTHEASRRKETAEPYITSGNRKKSSDDKITILCIESSPNHLEWIVDQLSMLGMDVYRTSDWDEGVQRCFTQIPDILIVQVTGSESQPLEHIRHLAMSRPIQNMPILLVNEGGAIDSGALLPISQIRVLTAPIHGEDILHEVHKLLQMQGREFGKVSDLSEKPKDSHAGKSAIPVPGAENFEVITPFEYKPLSILCIDDDPVIIRTIALRLQPYGIKVRGADNGTQGYLSATSTPPDLILLDLKMPNGQGNYVLGKLKENPRTQKVPVVILTMETTAGVQRQMAGLGADGFVTKPVYWPELFSQIGRCVQLPRQLLIDYNLPEQLTVRKM